MKTYSSAVLASMFLGWMALLVSNILCLFSFQVVLWGFSSFGGFFFTNAGSSIFGTLVWFSSLCFNRGTRLLCLFIDSGLAVWQQSSKGRHPFEYFLVTFQTWISKARFLHLWLQGVFSSRWWDVGERCSAVNSWALDTDLHSFLCDLQLCQLLKKRQKKYQLLLLLCTLPA